MNFIIKEEVCEMEWLTNEMIFYGGIATAGVSALAAIIFLFIFKMKKIKLNAQLDQEYGKRNK